MQDGLGRRHQSLDIDDAVAAACFTNAQADPTPQNDRRQLVDGQRPLRLRRDKPFGAKGRRKAEGHKLGAHGLLGTRLAQHKDKGRADGLSHQNGVDDGAAAVNAATTQRRLSDELDAGAAHPSVAATSVTVRRSLPVGDIVSSSRATRGSVTPRHRLSQDELANGLGVARKGVMRAFADWIDAGVLTKRGAYYVVVNMERRRDEAPQDVLGIDWVAGGRLAEGVGAGRRRR